MDDRFSRFGITQFFSRQPLHSSRVLQRLDRRIQFFGRLNFLFDFLIEFQTIFAHPLVLLDDGRIPERNSNHGSGEKQENHDSCEFVPNGESGVQWSE